MNGASRMLRWSIYANRLTRYSRRGGGGQRIQALLERISGRGHKPGHKKAVDGQDVSRMVCAGPPT